MRSDNDGLVLLELGYDVSFVIGEDAVKGSSEGLGELLGEI